MMADSAENFDPDFAGPGEWATMYRSNGLQVIPCYNPGEPKTGSSWKRPRLSEWETLQESLIPDASFERWYGAGGEYASRQNMGILTGRASKNTFVIDLDDHKGPTAADWWRGILAKHNHSIEPETWRQNTGGGGRQILFQARLDWHAPTNRTPIGVDIRGQGGFAVMPSSVHENGKHYEWAPGYAPFEIPIAEAPDWLLSEIEILVEQYGGDKGPAGQRKDRTSSPQSDFDAFGNRQDGRETYMADCVWHAVLETYRSCPIMPSETEQKTIAEEAYKAYERGVKSRLTGADKTALLEREGRGPSEFWSKWKSTIKHWSGKVAAEANKPRPGQSSSSNQYNEADFEAAFEKAEEQAKTDPGALFEFLDVRQIKTTPDPKWLVDGLVIEEALGFIFGPPGCLKTFIALGIGLSIATGSLQWWGRQIQRKGAVVYISSEGQGDLKFRIQAWEHKNCNADDAPFYLIRQTINFMKAEDVGKLLATVEAIAKVAGTDIATVFVDTVSRVIPGADENLQKDMTIFVAACDAVRQKFKTTVIGVHHTSRNGNIRGSTVLGGAGDFLIEVNREPGAKQGSIKAEKIKAAEDGWTQNFTVEEVPCGDIGGHSSLFVEGAGAEDSLREEKPSGWPAKDVLRRILVAIGEAWDSGRPWSSFPQATKHGRFAPLNISTTFEISTGLAKHIVETWLSTGVLSVEVFNLADRTKGLKVTGCID